jgi:hypothetical protein
MSDRRWPPGALAPIALALVVLLPRLVSPQFGLLDDGLTLQTGRQVTGRWSSVLELIPETGRFFPAYWLVHAVIFAAVGVRPLAFFAVNVLVLGGLLFLLRRLMRRGGASPAEAAVAATVFALSGPAIEAFYTLSKAEPWQLVWIALSLVAAAAGAQARRPTQVGLLALAAAILVIAHATKETSLVLMPISLAWAGLAWWRNAPAVERRFAIGFAAANVVAALGFVALRGAYAARSLGEGWYTRAYALDAATMGPALFRIAAWLVRDFLFLLPLAVVALVVLVRGRPGARRLLRYALVWMVGWLAVFLPWPATFEYHLLPFALGASVLAGVCAGEAWRWRGRGASLRQAATWLVLGSAGLAWGMSLVNAAADARIQLTVDLANADVVDFLGGVPPDSVVVLNTARVNEYLHELALHLEEIKHRPDVRVESAAVAAVGSSAARRLPVFVATPDIANRPRPTVRIAVDEAGARRASAALGAVLDGRGELVYRTARHARVLELGLHRALCRIAVPPVLDPTYCPPGRGLVERQTFAYGWQVHRLAPARRPERGPDVAPSPGPAS